MGGASLATETTSIRREQVPGDFRIVADGLAFPEGPNAMLDGSVVLVEVRGGTVARVRPDGQIERIAHVGGGPNSAAVGPDGAIYVVNNGGYPWTQRSDGSWFPSDPRTGSRTPEGFTGGWVERVDPETGRVDRIYETVSGTRLSAPCDIVFDAAGNFWFTDAGKARARSKDLGGLYYAAP